MLKSLFHHLKIFLKGSIEYEKEWEQRQTSTTPSGDWNETDPDWIKGYWESIAHPHREYLVNVIAALNPKSVLEIGCNCGPNLRLLAKKLPDCRLVGIDINHESVEKGNIWLNSEGISNVQLIVGRADNLNHFEDNSFDVVFSDAVLIYIGPDKIDHVIQEMIRKAKKNIILLEWQNTDSPFIAKLLKKEKFLFSRGLWIRDYFHLFNKFISKNRIQITRLPLHLWNDKFWQRYGSLIQIDIQPESAGAESLL